MLRWFGTLTRLWRTRRWFRFLIYALPVLAVLVLLGPALGVLNQLLKLGVSFLTPIVKSPGGRFVLVNLLLVAVVLVLYAKGKDRIRSLLAYQGMKHFLSGMQLLSGGFTREAARRFTRVVRLSRWVDFERVLSAYPEIVADAEVRLGLCAYRSGDLDGALRWLELARKRKPPAGVMATLREVRAIVYHEHPTLADETAWKELDEASRKDPSNVRVNRVMLERAEAEGDAIRALDMLRRIHAATEGDDRRAAGDRLVAYLYERARAFHERGEHGQARGLLKEAEGVRPGSESVHLLLGDVELARGNEAAALKAWAVAPGPASRSRVARLLEAGADPRQVLARYPHAEVLLDVARRLIGRGAHAQAARTLEKAAAVGADPVEVEKLLGDVSHASADDERARLHYLRAMTRVFGGRAGEPDVPALPPGDPR